MSISLTTLTCPACGASLSVEEGRDTVYCAYCRTPIKITNENEYIYRHIDEAGIKQAETERIVELKKLEMAERDRIAAEKTKSLKIKISLILGAIGIIMMTVGYMAGSASGDSESGFYMLSMAGFFPLMGAAYIWLFSKDKDDDTYDGKIRVPSSIDDFESKSYVAVEAILKSAGFSNIRCVPLGDLRTGLLKKPNMVESITVNGEDITISEKKYFPDSNIVISYHSFK